MRRRIGQAIKELNHAGRIVGTTVQAEGRVVQMIQAEIMTAAIMQKQAVHLSGSQAL